MKSYDETIQSIFEKGDDILAARKKRGALIRRITLSVSGICAAVLIGVGIRNSDAVRNGWENNFGGDNFISETVTTTTALTTTSTSTAMLTTVHTTSTETTASTSAAATSTQTDTTRSVVRTTRKPVTTTAVQTVTTSTSSQTTTSATTTTATPVITTTTTFNGNTGSPGGGASPPPGGGHEDTTAATTVTSPVTTTTVSIPPQGDCESSRYFACIQTFVSTLSYAPDIPVTYNAVWRMKTVPECSEVYEIPNLVTDITGELRIVTMHIFVFTETGEESAVAVRFNDTPEFYLYMSFGS